MNTLFTVALLLLNGATAARLRTHAKAAAGTKATTVDGVEFTSIFDHPETASFFVNKKPEEVGHMITSAIYAHVKNHQNLATKKNIREPDSLKQEAFAQLAAKHGVDFSTLKKLHARRVNPKEKDMEVWFHELAMHKETHVTHEEYALLDEQDKQTKEALATQKNEIRATAKTAKQKKTFAKRYVVAPNDRYFAPNFDKHAHLAPLGERRQKRHTFSSPTKTLDPSFLEAMKATRAANLIAVQQRRKEYIYKLAERSGIAETKNKNKNMKKMKQRGLQKNKQNNHGLDNVLLKKPTATTFLEARVSRWENIGGCGRFTPDWVCDAAEWTAESDIAQAAAALACPRNRAYNAECNADCQCASEHCDNTAVVGTWRCVHAYHSRTGGVPCTSDDECNSRLCKGNYDITSGGKQFEEGRCTYEDGHLTGGSECWENSECAAPTVCKGNNAGICTDTITAGGCSRGICQRAHNSLIGGSTECLEDAECMHPCNGCDGVCIGNNAGVCTGGTCEYGVCQRQHHSLSGGSTCLKDNECAHPHVCKGNNGGVVVPGTQPIEGACQHTDNSLDHAAACLENAECAHICDGNDCDGVCIGNAGGVCVAGACSVGHCQKLDHSISGGHQCYKNRECARICPGNGDDCDGICTNNNHGVSAGRCARPAGSLHARSLPNNLVEIDECTRNIECDSGRCVGNNADMGAWNSGHCSWDEGSRRGGETCSKNAECESNICMGNGGGLLTVFGTENAGQCAHVDGSLGYEEACSKNSECSGGGTDGGCIGNSWGTDAWTGDFGTGQCIHDDKTIGGTCDCSAGNPPDSICPNNDCSGSSFDAAQCVDWGCEYTYERDICTRNSECQSEYCIGNSALVPNDHQGWRQGHCAAVDGSILPFHQCYRDEECQSFVSGMVTDSGCEKEIGNDHGYCLQVSQTVGGTCRCKKNSECASNTCDGNWGGVSDSGGRCTASPGSRAQGESCSKNEECLSGVCSGNWHGAGTGNCAAGVAGVLAVGEECQHNQLCESNCCRGNAGGLISGTCRRTTDCVSGLVRAAGKWMADLVRRGLALLAGGMIRVLRWIIEAAQRIYEEVTATIQGYRDKLTVLATWVANLDTECPYVRDPTSGVSTRTPPSLTGDALTRCLGLVEDVATKLSESNMEKQMSSMKAASTRSKSQVCANPSDNGDNCNQRTDIADAVAEWAPQYWADALGISFKFLEGSVHKILDFQTMEYGYATDMGLGINAQFIADVWGMEEGTEFAPLLMSGGIGDISASITTSVGFKGKNRANWKNLNAGYTGDAFGVGLSGPLFAAGPFSIEGGVALGIQSQYGCTFLDSAFAFVGHPTPEEVAQNCPSAASGLLEVTNDIFNNMFVWDGTKTVGLSLSASYDPPDPPDPTKSARAYRNIARKKRAARRAARRAERTTQILSVPDAVEEYGEVYQELNDVTSTGLTREEKLARIACGIEEVRAQNEARGNGNSQTSSASSSSSSSSRSSSSSTSSTNNEDNEEDEDAGVTSAIGNIQGCEADAMRNVGAARQFLDGTPEERQAAFTDFAVQLGYEIAVGSAATWVDTVAPSAFEALANAETGVSFGASISSTRLLPMYSGCFGPMAKDDGTDHSDAESINGDIDNNEKFQGLLDFLGYIWMGEDHRLNELDAAAGTGDSWFVRLAQLLGNLMQSAQQIPIRVLQTVLAVVQHETNRKHLPGNCGCQFCLAVNTDTCVPCEVVAGGEMTTSRCRARHWCVSPVSELPDSGTCWAKDFSGNFYEHQLTHASIDAEWKCQEACELTVLSGTTPSGTPYRTTCEWVSRGQCARCPTDINANVGEVGSINDACQFANNNLVSIDETENPLEDNSADAGTVCHPARTSGDPCNPGLQVKYRQRVPCVPVLEDGINNPVMTCANGMDSTVQVPAGYRSVRAHPEVCTISEADRTVHHPQIDDTDPANPLVHCTASGGGTTSPVPATHRSVRAHPEVCTRSESERTIHHPQIDDTDPANPLVHCTTSGGGTTSPVSATYRSVRANPEVCTVSEADRTIHHAAVMGTRRSFTSRRRRGVRDVCSGRRRRFWGARRRSTGCTNTVRSYVVTAAYDEITPCPEDSYEMVQEVVAPAHCPAYDEIQPCAENEYEMVQEVIAPAHCPAYDEIQPCPEDSYEMVQEEVTSTHTLHCCEIEAGEEDSGTDKVLGCSGEGTLNQDYCFDPTHSLRVRREETWMVGWPQTKQECDDLVPAGGYKGTWSINGLPVPINPAPDTTSFAPYKTWTVTIPTDFTPGTRTTIIQATQTCVHCEWVEKFKGVLESVTVSDTTTTATISSAEGQTIDPAIPIQLCASDYTGFHCNGGISASTFTIAGEVLTPGNKRAAPAAYIQFLEDGVQQSNQVLDSNGKCISGCESTYKATIDAIVGELAAGLTGSAPAIHGLTSMVGDFQQRVHDITTNSNSPVGEGLQDRLQAKGCLEQEEEWPAEWN